MNATNPATAKQLAAATEAARRYLNLETLDTRRSDSLDFHDISVASIRAVVRLAFEAGYAAASGRPAADAVDFTDPAAVLATLKIAKRTGRRTGGTWVRGSIAGHDFEALVFPEQPENPNFEIPGSRISKFWLREHGTGREVACFERGWDRHPATPAARVITDLLAAGLAETVFGK